MKHNLQCLSWCHSFDMNWNFAVWFEICLRQHCRLGICSYFGDFDKYWESETSRFVLFVFSRCIFFLCAPLSVFALLLSGYAGGDLRAWMVSARRIFGHEGSIRQAGVTTKPSQQLILAASVTQPIPSLPRLLHKCMSSGQWNSRRSLFGATANV